LEPNGSIGYFSGVDPESLEFEEVEDSLVGTIINDNSYNRAFSERLFAVSNAVKRSNLSTP